jgi:hypothetical protein
VNGMRAVDAIGDVDHVALGRMKHDAVLIDDVHRRVLVVQPDRRGKAADVDDHLNIGGVQLVEWARTTNHTVDEVLKIGRGVSGDPCGGSEFGGALDGRVGEAGQDVGEVVAHRNLEPSAAFDHREDRRHARSSLFAAENTRHTQLRK